MPLELTNHRNSIQSLAALLEVAESDTRMGQFTEVERNGIRAGGIQNFEVTSELAWKLMARWLNTHVGIADGSTRRQLFRLAAESNLIHDVDQWMQHHEARNTTTHTYDEAKAAWVYQETREFVHDARYLLQALDASND